MTTEEATELRRAMLDIVASAEPYGISRAIWVDGTQELPTDGDPFMICSIVELGSEDIGFSMTEHKAHAIFRLMFPRAGDRAIRLAADQVEALLSSTWHKGDSSILAPFGMNVYGFRKESGFDIYTTWLAMTFTVDVRSYTV